MKKCIFLIWFTQFSVLAEGSDLQVQVKNIKQTKGKILAQLVDANKKPVQVAQAEVKSSVVVVTFKNVPKGRFAVQLFQDLNNDMKIDTGLFGIPKEPWGVSNNVRAIMSAPDFNDMLFDFSNDLKIAISLQ